MKGHQCCVTCIGLGLGLGLFRVGQAVVYRGYRDVS